MSINKNPKSIKRLWLIATIALLIQTAVPFTIGTAFASPPTWTYVQIIFNRLKASTATTGTICASFSASNITAIGTTSTTLSVVFPTGFTVSSTVGNWTINTTSQADWPAGAAAWTGLSAPSGGTGVVGQQVNFNVAGASNPSSSGVYCFNWTNTAAISTSTAGNDLSGSITMAHGAYPGSTAELQSNWATSVVSNDQITVTATVPPTFTLALSGNSQAFGNLSPTAHTATSGLTATITTNAASGWVAFVQDANFKTVTDTGSNPANRHGALESATAGNYVISNNTTNSLGTAAHSVTTGSEDYGFAVTTVTAGGGGQTGTPSANAAYDSTSGTKAGPIDPTQLRPFASSGGDSNGDVITFLERAEIAGITPAATDYTDTLTIVAAGKF